MVRSRCRPLYAIPDAALADLPPVEVQSYISLLNRFALLGDLRRQLHYGPRLRAWFDRIAAGKDCDALTREAVIYFSATPESLGGSTATAQKLGARCPEPRASPP